MALFSNKPRVLTSRLARRGVGEGDFTAEDLPVQGREGVRRLGVHQAEKLQLVDVKVANGLHDWKLGDHLGRGNIRQS